MNLGTNHLLAEARKGLDGTITRGEIFVIAVCAVAITLLGAFV